jgi:hypothetical protein
VSGSVVKSNNINRLPKVFEKFAFDGQKTRVSKETIKGMVVPTFSAVVLS